MADKPNNKTRVQAGSSPKGRAGVARRPSQGQKTTSRSYETRAAERKARGASHAKSPASEVRAPRRRSTSVGSGSSNARRRSASKASTVTRAQVSAGGSSLSLASLKDRLFANKLILGILAVVVVCAFAVVVDGLAHFGKAYGNVSINGMSVAGMTAEDMRAALDEQYGSKLPDSQVSVYASEEAREKEVSKYAQQENEATAEQISVEDAQSRVTSWTTDGASLGASLPYDEVIAEALSAGRKGGPFGRLAIAIAGEDVPLAISFDGEKLDSFAADIDKTMGDARQDATVVIEGGRASAVEGHDGRMVDRSWLAERISDVFLGRDAATYVVAELSDAPSRTTLEQAEQLRDAVNRALATGAVFTYRTNRWTADASELGSWTIISVEENEGSYGLKASIDADTAAASLVKSVSAQGGAKLSDVVVDFEVADGEVTVKTSGAAEIPEVVPAVERVGEALYGEGGAAWASAPAPQPIAIEIGESAAPEQLMFDQALDLGIVSVIGEYTTEFSNDEGTENRNHNIRLVSDILDNTVCESGGGQWSFNEHTGDTNLDPPFASAGSIVNGEYVDSIGGGICQVATTIFNAVFEAGLDVPQRRNHSLYIGSYPTGRDVGVSYPELDFVWANQLKSDVLLKLSYTDTSVTAKLYGVYTGYKVESDVGEWEEGSTYKTDFEEDDTLAKGDYYLKTVGEDGSKISVTRTVTDKDGNIVSETVFESVYEPKNEVYVIGPGTETSKLVHTAQERVPAEDGAEGGDGYEGDYGEPEYYYDDEPEELYYDESYEEA